MARKNPSLAQIAQAAGVSTATVSNVLNGKGRYSERTRLVVEEVARREGYVPSFSAKALRTSRTETVGIVTTDVTNDFYSSLVLCVERGLRDAGYTSYICNTGGDREREAAYLEDLVRKQADGIVLVGGPPVLSWDGPARRTPCVAVDRRVLAAGGIVKVGNDLRALVASVVDLLASKGCRRVGYLTSDCADALEGDPRFTGFLEGAAQNGLAYDPSLVMTREGGGPSYEASAASLDRALSAGAAMDGIVAVGDRVAMGALGPLRARGLAVGSDVRLAGMDDSLYSRMVTPPITSVNRNVDAMGAAAVEALLALVDDRPARDATVPFFIVERESTG